LRRRLLVAGKDGYMETSPVLEKSGVVNIWDHSAESAVVF
jgi:hypothetical protein